MSSNGNENIESVLKETRTFPPPATFSANAHISSEEQYEAMWNRAKDDPSGLMSIPLVPEIEPERLRVLLRDNVEISQAVDIVYSFILS
ncbi:MAG: hypothetical protein ACPGXX_05485, partial [Planctomycetaceae bacterium]